MDGEGQAYATSRDAPTPTLDVQEVDLLEKHLSVTRDRAVDAMNYHEHCLNEARLVRDSCIAGLEQMQQIRSQPTMEPAGRVVDSQRL